MDRKKNDKKRPPAGKELLEQYYFVSEESQILQLKVERLESKANNQQILITNLKKNLREVTAERDMYKRETLRAGMHPKQRSKTPNKPRSKSFEIVEISEHTLKNLISVSPLKKSDGGDTDGSNKNSNSGSKNKSSGGGDKATTYNYANVMLDVISEKDFDTRSTRSTLFLSRPKQIHVTKFNLNCIENQYAFLMNFEEDIRKHAGGLYQEIREYIKEASQSMNSDDIYEFVEYAFDVLMKTNTIKDKWAGQQKADISLMIENFIFECLFEKIFVFDEDAKAKSMQLQEKFYVLQNLISVELLEIPPEYQIPSLFTYCQNELKKINGVKSPYNKMRVIEHVYQNLINTFMVDGKKPSAEDVFPLFIYVVLQANPDNLHLNIEYIYRFVRKRLLVGEYGYTLTNLSAAVSFLESLDGGALIQGCLMSGRGKSSL